MKTESTVVAGVFLLELERTQDERGYFARTFCREEFADAGLNPCVSQCSLSFNTFRGTLRGLHFQRQPHEECKLVRCTRGRVHDVVVDLRRGSETYLKSAVVELTASSGRAIYIPQGCAHGFMTLEDKTELSYQISSPYSEQSAAGVRWNDPAFALQWPCEPTRMSQRDREYADYCIE